MNEKIKALLTPALVEIRGASGGNFSKELEQFAMNIINECIQCVDVYIDGGVYTDPHEALIEMKTAKRCRQTIKEEFQIK